ncbi:MAG TPA: tetratricopeptide repeat protein, partial [Bryobacteraceae bacterium]|nr:tetratricopeptide repeat protein [Bryobacteraceae bacterium]
MYYGWLKVLSAVQRLTLAATLWWWAFWQPASAAALARSAHFEVYAQAGEPAARTVLAWFERLHAFFLQQTGLKLDDRPAVRVIAFASAQDYEPFRIRPTADAYYVGAPDRDWIVMTSAGSGAFRIAAHEYTHFVLRANGFHLPPWLNEGLAEFFSGVQAEPGTRSIGNGPAVRTRALRRRPWMPLSDLLTLPDESAIRDQADGSELFYAESWALTDMLLGAPEYAPRFEDLIAALRSGAASPAAVAEVYRRPIDEIARDLREWVARRKPRPLPLPPADSTPAEASEISSFDWHLQLAELRMATGRWDAAQAAYAALEREQPNDPDIPGALAAIALRKGDADRARSEWERASALGIRDAAAWYRYAVLAQEAGFTPAEVRAAFERAIALRPGFDDALFRLSQLENNAGRFASAVEHLREIRAVPPARQYAYWTAMAYALGELGRREEARAAAGNAETHAATAEQRR